MFSFPLQGHQVFLFVSGGSRLCSGGVYLLEKSKENNEWDFFLLVISTKQRNNPFSLNIKVALAEIRLLCL